MALAAGLTMHESIGSRRCFLLLEADGKPFVVEKTIGAGRLLVIANGSFLLNEGVVHPRRPLAEHVLAWIGGGRSERVAMVDGPSVLGDGEGMLPDSGICSGEFHPCDGWRYKWVWPRCWRLLARAPRPLSGVNAPTLHPGTDRPAEHAVAAGGALLAKTKAARGRGSRTGRLLPAMADAPPEETWFPSLRRLWNG